jgi:hypothetical protein
VTLNLGRNIVAQLTIWIVVINPISKYALDLAPVALGLEYFIQVQLRVWCLPTEFNLGGSVVRIFELRTLSSALIIEAE